MKLLLPSRYKRYGLMMVPTGVGIWMLMQVGVTENVLLNFLDEHSPAIVVINIVIAALSFFCFLIGLYFLVFSKEKVEDEMIQKLRLECFQFAARIQMLLLIVGFLLMLLYKEPAAEGMMYFFILLLLIFWFSFIGRFHYILHVRIKQLNDQH